MKVISLLQPWATLVVIGAKKIETRSWKTKFRGEILIHASKRWDNELYQTIIDIGAEEALQKAGYHLTKIINGRIQTNLPLGAIIGKVELTDVYTTEEVEYYLNNFHSSLTTLGRTNVEDWQQEKAFGDYSFGRFCWSLNNPVQFAQPISAKGSLSLWDYDLPDHFHVPNKYGGHATFPTPPDQKTLDAVNKLTELAYKNLK